MLLHDVVAGAPPDSLALVFGDSAITFAELADRVARVSVVFGALAGPGECVAILAENRPEYVECLYGLPRAGLIALPLNYRLHPDEWAAQLDRAGVQVVVGERELLDRLTATGADFTAVDFDGDYESRLAAAAPGAPVASDADDAAWLLFTSGTTGMPKGAVLTHAGILAAVDATAAARRLRDDEVYLFPFPLCHIAAYNIVLLHRRARPVVLVRRFDPDVVLQAIERYRVTIVSLAPTMIDVLLHAPARDLVDRSSLRTIAYGASAIPEPVLRGAAEVFGCEFSQGYGMTELSGNAVFLDAEAHRRALAGETHLLSAAGVPAPGVELRIVDDALVDDALVDVEVGEIAVRAPQVMREYWRDPEATSAAIVDGWLRTGDVGRIDDEGFLYVVDRKKDVIVSGGENVASREVEAVLRRHPGVRDVAVVGVPDERWGERVCAVVVPRDAGAPPDPDDLAALVGEHLAGFKKPRQITFVESLPVNAAGKVVKAELRMTLASQAQ